MNNAAALSGCGGPNEIFGKIVLTESSWVRGETGEGRSEGE